MVENGYLIKAIFLSIYFSVKKKALLKSITKKIYMVIKKVLTLL